MIYFYYGTDAGTVFSCASNHIQEEKMVQFFPELGIFNQLPICNTHLVQKLIHLVGKFKELYIVTLSTIAVDCLSFLIRNKVITEQDVEFRYVLNDKEFQVLSLDCKGDFILPFPDEEQEVSFRLHFGTLKDFEVVVPSES